MNPETLVVGARYLFRRRRPITIEYVRRQPLWSIVSPSWSGSLFEWVFLTESGAELYLDQRDFEHLEASE